MIHINKNGEGWRLQSGLLIHVEDHYGNKLIQDLEMNKEGFQLKEFGKKSSGKGGCGWDPEKSPRGKKNNREKNP